MEHVIATPKPGTKVRHENGQVLDPKGEPVPRNTYWLRRQKDGDVTLSTLPKAKAPKA